MSKYRKYSPEEKIQIVEGYIRGEYFCEIENHLLCEWSLNYYIKNHLFVMDGSHFVLLF